MVLVSLGVAGCGPGGGGEDADGGGSEDGADDGDGPSSDDDGPSSDDDSPPTDDGGICPSDAELFVDVVRSVAAQGLDPGSLDEDPRFEEEFCAAYCPSPPEDDNPLTNFSLSYCAPVDLFDVLPGGLTNGGSEETSGDPDTGSSTGTDTEDTSDGGTADATSEGGGTTTTSGPPEDDQLVEVRCHYWPGCL